MRIAIILLTIILLSTHLFGTSNGKESFTTLREECRITMDHNDFKSMAVVADRLLKLSQKEGNKVEEGFANFYLGTSALFNGDTEKARTCLHQAKDIAYQFGNDSLMSQVYNNLGIYEIMVSSNPYMAKTYLLQAIAYGSLPSGFNRSVGGAYTNLAELSLMLRDTTGIEYARKSYEYGRDNNRLSNMSCGAAALASLYYLTGRNDSAMKYVTTALDIYEKHNIVPMPDVYITLSALEMDKNNLTDAFRYALTAIGEAESRNELYLSPAYLQLAKVQQKSNDLKGSNLSLEKAMKTVRQSGMKRYYVDILKLMGENYERMGLMSEAAKCYKQANDSIENANKLERQQILEEREFVLKSERELRQQEQRENESRNREKLITFLIIVAVLLMGLLVVTLLSYRRRTVLYRSIVQQNREAIKREEELKNKILKMEELSAKNADEVERKQNQNRERAENLYACVTKLMEEERLYADPQLSRDRLADQLETNRTYLSHAINEVSGMNFAQFVNSYRIKEAIRILSDPNLPKQTISELAVSLGFNNATTFNKLFQAHTGMSPSTYRKSVS